VRGFSISGNFLQIDRLTTPIRFSQIQRYVRRERDAKMTGLENWMKWMEEALGGSLQYPRRVLRVVRLVLRGLVSGRQRWGLISGGLRMYVSVDNNVCSGINKVTAGLIPEIF
jgi:hypothetical protein